MEVNEPHMYQIDAAIWKCVRIQVLGQIRDEELAIQRDPGWLKWSYVYSAH